MDAPISVDKFRFLVYRFKERLWVKPLTFCVLSIAAVFTAKIADGLPIAEHLPVIDQASVEALLSIMASSMLVIATFSAGTMVNAYASASRSSTPRSVSLLIADDVSQNALSTFVGAFIFSVVALTTAKNAFFADAGVFLLFVLTGIVFAVVILTFIRWVDSVARLGRVGSTVKKVEDAASKAIHHRINNPRLAGTIPPNINALVEQGAEPIFTDEIGYVQLVDMPKAHTWASNNNARVHIQVLPGDFVTPDKPLAYIESNAATGQQLKHGAITASKGTLVSAFNIGDERSFEADPRFGLIVLAEIGARALSPSVNDPGTAISIIGSYTRLLTYWSRKENNNVNHSEKKDSQHSDKNKQLEKYTNVTVPKLNTADMFNDAFTPIARDGANMIEVSVQLLKSLEALSKLPDEDVSVNAINTAKSTYKRSLKKLSFEDDIATLEKHYFLK